MLLQWPVSMDIDDIYYSRVKTIYSSIIEFGSRILSLFTLSSEKAEDINNIKIANRHIVEAIKDTKGLRANLNQFMVSDNKYIQKEYDNLRKRITQVLREIYLTATDDDAKSHQKR